MQKSDKAVEDGDDKSFSLWNFIVGIGKRWDVGKTNQTDNQTKDQNIVKRQQVKVYKHRCTRQHHLKPAPKSSSSGSDDEEGNEKDKKKQIRRRLKPNPVKALNSNLEGTNDKESELNADRLDRSTSQNKNASHVVSSKIHYKNPLLPTQHRQEPSTSKVNEAPKKPLKTSPAVESSSCTLKHRTLSMNVSMLDGRPLHSMPASSTGRVNTAVNLSNKIAKLKRELHNINRIKAGSNALVQIIHEPQKAIDTDKKIITIKHSPSCSRALPSVHESNNHLYKADVQFIYDSKTMKKTSKKEAPKDIEKKLHDPKCKHKESKHKIIPIAIKTSRKLHRSNHRRHHKHGQKSVEADVIKFEAQQIEIQRECIMKDYLASESSASKQRHGKSSQSLYEERVIPFLYSEIKHLEKQLQLLLQNTDGGEPKKRSHDAKKISRKRISVSVSKNSMKRKSSSLEPRRDANECVSKSRLKSNPNELKSDSIQNLNRMVSVLDTKKYISTDLKHNVKETVLPSSSKDNVHLSADNRNTPIIIQEPIVIKEIGICINSTDVRSGPVSIEKVKSNNVIQNDEHGEFEDTVDGTDKKLGEAESTKEKYNQNLMFLKQNFEKLLYCGTPGTLNKRCTEADKIEESSEVKDEEKNKDTVTTGEENERSDVKEETLMETSEINDTSRADGDKAFYNVLVTNVSQDGGLSLVTDIANNSLSTINNSIVLSNIVEEDEASLSCNVHESKSYNSIPSISIFSYKNYIPASERNSKDLMETRKYLKKFQNRTTSFNSFRNNTFNIDKGINKSVDDWGREKIKSNESNRRMNSKQNINPVAISSASVNKDASQRDLEGESTYDQLKHAERGKSCHSLKTNAQTHKKIDKHPDLNRKQSSTSLVYLFVVNTTESKNNVLTGEKKSKDILPDKLYQLLHIDRLSKNANVSDTDVPLKDKILVLNPETLQKEVIPPKKESKPGMLHKGMQFKSECTPPDCLLDGCACFPSVFTTFSKSEVSIQTVDSLGFVSTRTGGSRMKEKKKKQLTFCNTGENSYEKFSKYSENIKIVRKELKVYRTELNRLKDVWLTSLSHLEDIWHYLKDTLDTEACNGKLTEGIVLAFQNLAETTLFLSLSLAWNGSNDDMAQSYATLKSVLLSCNQKKKRVDRINQQGKR